jgi:Glutathione S-transferase, N-terminal domain
MKLYVCYGTWKPAPRPGGHPCGQAYHALKDAGYDPEVKRSYGLGAFPDFLNNMTSGRREVKRLTGSYWVPVLVADDGTVIQGSREIIDWARANPAPAATPAAEAS